MTEDRYVIVYRDGSMSFPMTQAGSDKCLRMIRRLSWPSRAPRPAYRIRCREKALPPRPPRPPWYIESQWDKKIARDAFRRIQTNLRSKVFP